MTVRATQADKEKTNKRRRKDEQKTKEGRTKNEGRVNLRGTHSGT